MLFLLPLSLWPICSSKFEGLLFLVQIRVSLSSNMLRFLALVVSTPLLFLTYIVFVSYLFLLPLGCSSSFCFEASYFLAFLFELCELIIAAECRVVSFQWCFVETFFSRFLGFVDKLFCYCFVFIGCYLIA